MKFIRDIISERRSQKPAEMALPEAAVLPPPLADTPLRRSISAEGPLPLPQRQAEPSRANIFAEAEAMEDFAEPDFLDDEPALAPQASAPAGLVMTEDLGAGFEAEDGSGADPLDGADGPMGGADPFDRLRGAAPEPRAEAAAFSSQRALRLERPILSPREPASLARSPFAEPLRPAEDRAEPRAALPRADMRAPEMRPAEARSPEPRFEGEPPLRRPVAPEPQAAAPRMAAPRAAFEGRAEPRVEPRAEPPGAAQPFVTARPAPRIEEHPEETPFEVPPPAAGRGANRSGRVKTRLLGFNPDGMGLADPFEKPQAQANPAFPVAWLVVVSGPGRGASFSLHDGVSRIGRGEDQTVPLAFGDTSISRENHAAIAYDAEQNAFFVGQSGKANIVRLNNKPLLSTEQLKSGDQIRLGETTLRFVALCGPEFDWNRQG